MLRPPLPSLEGSDNWILAAISTSRNMEVVSHPSLGCHEGRQHQFKVIPSARLLCLMPDPL